VKDCDRRSNNELCENIRCIGGAGNYALICERPGSFGGVVGCRPIPDDAGAEEAEKVQENQPSNIGTAWVAAGWFEF